MRKPLLPRIPKLTLFFSDLFISAFSQDLACVAGARRGKGEGIHPKCQTGARSARKGVGAGACAQAFPPDFPYSPSPLVQASQDYVYVAG